MTKTKTSSADSIFPSWKNRIVLKFMLISLPFLVLISLSLLLVAPYWYRQQSLQALQDKARSIGQIAAYSLAPAIIFDDQENIKEVLNSLTQSPEIDYIIIFDAKDKEISRFQRSQAFQPPAEEIRKTGFVQNNQFWNLYTEIKQQRNLVGHLALGFSLKELQHQIFHIRRIIWLASFFILAIGLGIIYFLSLLITRPLRYMTRTVTEIAAGNLDQRAEVKTSDEVGTLARSFNSMVEQLHKTLDSLEEARGNLEKKVEERTLELKQQVEEKEAIAKKLKESEELFRSMVETLGEGVVIVDPQENFVFVNQAARRIFNDYEEKLEGRNLKEFTSPSQYELIRQQTARRKQGFRDVYDLELTLEDGSQKTVIVNAAPRFDPDGNFISTLAVMTDITERKKEELALTQAKQKLEKAISELEFRNEENRLLVAMGDSFQLANSEKEAVEIIKSYALKLFPGDGFLLYSRQGQEKFLQLVASWNHSLPAEGLIDLNDCWGLRKASPNFFIDQEKDLLCPHLKTSVHPDHPVACLPLYSSGETLGLMVVFCCQGKEAREPFENLEATMKVKKQLLLSFSQRVSMSLANIRLRESLREQSIRDPLTGLYNRRYLEETLERELFRAKRAGQPVAVIMLDIDYFKKINDFYGHDAGDFVLQTIAQTLNKSVRAEDIVCRFGGEEFTVILPTLPLEKAIARAELICDSVRHLEINFAGTFIRKITISAGVAAHPDHGEKWQEIIQAADLALLEAKNEGRDRIKVARKLGG